MAQKEQEAKRVRWLLKVFENTTQEINLLKYASLTSNPSHPDKQFSKQLKELKQLEKETLRFIRELTSPESGTDPFDEYEKDEEETAAKLDKFRDELQKSYKKLCNSFSRVEPKVFVDSSKDHSLRSRAVGSWTKIVDSISSYLKLSEQRLLSQQIETIKSQLSQLQKNEENSFRERDRLQKILHEEQTTRSQQKQEDTSKTSLLTRELNKLRDLIETNESEREKSCVETRKELEKQHDEKLKKFQAERENILKQIEISNSQNLETETEYRKKLKRIELELDEVRDGFNLEMIDLKKKVDNMGAMEKKENEEKEKVLAKLKVLVEEREAFEAAEAEKEKLAKKLEMQRQLSATQIQATFRGWKARKNVKSKKKSKK